MLELPEGMGVIIRTAGDNRTKVEVKRDYEYLMRLWENVRTKTLPPPRPASSTRKAPDQALIRDLYNKDIRKSSLQAKKAIVTPKTS